MIKYTVVWFRISNEEIDTEQMSKWFDGIQEAESCRLTLLNDEFLKFNAQNLRVIQYEFK